MPPSNILVPSLFGGISHQPPRLRHANQVEDATNAVFSVVDGMSKRPGSDYVRDITSDIPGSADETYRIHPINRDGEEQYLIIYGDDDTMNLEIFHVDGTKATVTKAAAALTYLRLNTPSTEQIKMVSIADYTLIVNTTVQLGASTAVLSYTVTKKHRNYRHMISELPAVDTYHQAEFDYLPDSADNVPLENEGFFHYNIEEAKDNDFASWQRDSTISGSWQDAGNRWRKKKESPGGFNIRFQRESRARTTLTYDHAGGPAELCLHQPDAFTDYTFEPGDEIFITGTTTGTTLAAGWYPIASKYDEHRIALLENDAGTGIDYRAAADNSVATHTSGDRNNCQSGYISKHYEMSIDFREGGVGVEIAAGDDLFDVAKRIEESLHDAGAEDTLVSWQPDTERQGSGEGVFQVVAPYRGAGSKVIGIYDPDSANIYSYNTGTGSSGPPFKFADGTANTPSLAPATSTFPVDERWDRVPPKNAEEAFIDETKMPVKLERTALNTFTLNPIASGVGEDEWKPRVDGNEDTNPIPSLWKDNLKISDISFHRNRLVLAGEENIVMSRIGDFWSFFLEDADNIIDSDPIDVALTADQITIIDFIANWRKTLIIFTKAGRQFELNTPDVMTPDKVSVSPTTSYPTHSIRPATSGTEIYFVGPRHQQSVCWEYQYDDSRVANTAGDITAHAHNLLPSTMRTIQAAKTDGRVFVLPENCNHIYVHQSHWTGPRKEQSAWAKWEWDDGYVIQDIAVIGNDMYMLVKSNSNFVIERVTASKLYHLDETDCHPAGGSPVLVQETSSSADSDSSDSADSQSLTEESSASGQYSAPSDCGECESGPSTVTIGVGVCETGTCADQVGTYSMSRIGNSCEWTGNLDGIYCRIYPQGTRWFLETSKPPVELGVADLGANTTNCPPTSGTFQLFGKSPHCSGDIRSITLA